MVKLDQYIVNKAQVIYDFLLDTFGIMRGTIAMFIVAINVALAIIAYNDTKNIAALITIISSVSIMYSASVDRAYQLKGDHTRCNAIALRARQSRLVLSVKAVTITLAILYAFLSLANAVTWNIPLELFNLTLVGYLLCVFTRDPESRREEKFVFNGA